VSYPFQHKLDKYYLKFSFEISRSFFILDIHEIHLNWMSLFLLVLILNEKSSHILILQLILIWNDAKIYLFIQNSPNGLFC